MGNKKPKKKKKKTQIVKELRWYCILSNSAHLLCFWFRKFYLRSLLVKREIAEQSPNKVALPWSPFDIIVRFLLLLLLLFFFYGIIMRLTKEGTLAINHSRLLKVGGIFFKYHNSNSIIHEFAFDRIF